MLTGRLVNLGYPEYPEIGGAVTVFPAVNPSLQFEAYVAFYYYDGLTDKNRIRLILVQTGYTADQDVRHIKQDDNGDWSVQIGLGILETRIPINNRFKGGIV